MKTTLHYSTFMTLYVHACGMTATVDMGCTPLKDVLQFAEAIFNNKTFFHGDSVEAVHVIDSKTGELIAECEPETASGPTAVKDDWDDDYDECGYDPYLNWYMERIKNTSSL